MKRILLIEDDTTLRETTAEILELENYEVVTAANGKKGVELAKLVQPNLIICDIMMPEMDGYKVLEILSSNKTTQRIPFIFMSAKTELSEVRKGMDLGADDYLTKPVSEELLISAIESRLAKAALLNENEYKKVDEDKDKNNYDHINSIEELKNYFCDFGTTKIFEKGALIYREGQFCNDVYLIYKGNVKSFKIDEFGKELILNIYSDDDFFGFSIASDNMPNYEATMAMEKTEVVYISKATLVKILDANHILYLQILKFINENLTEIKEQLMEMAYGSIRRKTAKTIIKFANKMAYKPTDKINISRRDLASVAGVATESLIRTLTNFKKEGILEIEGRNIRILNLDKLASIY
ncbi:response regulator [Lutibacter sp.]|uniref:response regulator n=1 Tax=Lutibacter sp. TaxID=1925666 RepID=UPI0025C5B61D|nr:response regulator [Lutibacter sp.]MCF6181566.1 response regulator [Lutibacter sp.]